MLGYFSFHIFWSPNASPMSTCKTRRDCHMGKVVDRMKRKDPPHRTTSDACITCLGSTYIPSIVY
jgi:hypothetical protein